MAVLSSVREFGRAITGSLGAPAGTITTFNQTIWAYSGAPCTSFIELGDTQGFAGSSGYFYYWGYNNNTGLHAQMIGPSDNGGNNHAYELIYDGNATYTAYLDFNNVGTVGGLGHGTCISQAGLELSGNDAGDLLAYEHADGFLDNPLEWADTGWNWHVGWALSETWQDHPCGVGYSVPDCLNRWWQNNSNNNFGNNNPSVFALIV